MSAELGTRPRQCPVELLVPGDVIEVYGCIENDDYEWLKRTVLHRDDARLYLRGGGREYSVRVVPGESYRLAYVDMPLLGEADGA